MTKHEWTEQEKKREWTEQEKLVMWGPGPWVGEADRLEWRRHGLVCLLTRNPLLGNLCGYVGVPPGHPMHQVTRSVIQQMVRVHGAITYAKPCDEEAGVCHVAAPDEPDDLWWFGFDCMHGHDIVPGQVRCFELDDEELDMLAGKGVAYRDQQYVCGQIDLLADQLYLLESVREPARL